VKEAALTVDEVVCLAKSEQVDPFNCVHDAFFFRVDAVLAVGANRVRLSLAVRHGWSVADRSRTISSDDVAASD
jgi:hypothetical protein